jgi:hypothetical protein
VLEAGLQSGRYRFDFGIEFDRLEPHFAAPTRLLEAAERQGRTTKIVGVRRSWLCRRLSSNATTFGLGSGVWTRDLGKAHRLTKGLRAGSVWINCYQAMDPAAPFGGYKMSGYGRESGIQQMEEYLNVKAVWIKTA